MKTLKLWHAAFSPQFNSNIHPRILENIDKWITLNPDLIIERHIVGDKECISFLKVFDEKNGTTTVKYFEQEPDGRFKADLWRLCVLYEHGGLYSDIDQEPIEPLHKYLNLDEIDFSTGLSTPSNYVNQGFLYSKKPKSKIIKKCLDAHLDRYKQKETVGVDGDMAGIHTMCTTIRNMFSDNNIPSGRVKIDDEECLFLTETPDLTLPNHSLEFMYSFGIYKDNLKVANTRYLGYYNDKNHI
jgi:hypothetical protein